MDRATWQLGRESRGHTALMDAASHGQEDKVKDILRSSVDPNDQLYSGMTALMFASKWGWDKVVRELLRGKADLFRRTDKGETALSLAQFYRKDRVVSMLKAAEKKRETKTNILPEDSISNVGDRPGDSISNMEEASGVMFMSTANSDVTSAWGSADGLTSTTERSEVTLISASGPNCFPAGSLLKSPSGMYVPVQDVVEGSWVVSSDGECLKTLQARRHESGDDGFNIFELATASAKLEVTGCHRILTATGNKRADALGAGEEVVVTGGVVETLLCARPSMKKIDVYEFTFFPNMPVEAWPPVHSCILSMATPPERQRATPPERQRRRTRRPGMNRRLARQAAAADDQHSIPQTEEVWPSYGQ